MRRRRSWSIQRLGLDPGCASLNCASASKLRRLCSGATVWAFDLLRAQRRGDAPAPGSAARAPPRVRLQSRSPARLRPQPLWGGWQQSRVAVLGSHPHTPMCRSWLRSARLARVQTGKRSAGHVGVRRRGHRAATAARRHAPWGTDGQGGLRGARSSARPTAVAYRCRAHRVAVEGGAPTGGLSTAVDLALGPFRSGRAGDGSLRTASGEPTHNAKASGAASGGVAVGTAARGQGAYRS